MKVSFSTDADGFLSQECPSCQQRFKVIFGEGSQEPISHCPYCGYKGQQCWLTQEQSDHVEAVATDIVIGPELKKLEREIGGLSKELFTINMESNLPKPSQPPVETDVFFDILHLPCCKETIKVNRQQQHFCIICGMEIDMTISDAKKIFLSHKGADKAKVVDFKNTLELLGYDPWLDEDAMPAGTSLERGLLQGMKESCGVVFFITPSFRDEGYLQTEIDYAVQEKRRKEDKFAIITLLFDSDGDERAQIPELLESYVWKEPKTSLEALREIVRALPVVPGKADWRDEIAGVATEPKTKSTASELSIEAKNLLKEAVAGDGIIESTRYFSNESIQTNGKEMITDRNPRTIALWKGGLEDLQRRRYIEDSGHEGKTFRVTREGYEAADELSDDAC